MTSRFKPAIWLCTATVLCSALVIILSGKGIVQQRDLDLSVSDFEMGGLKLGMDASSASRVLNERGCPTPRTAGDSWQLSPGGPVISVDFQAGQIVGLAGDQLRFQGKTFEKGDPVGDVFHELGLETPEPSLLSSDCFPNLHKLRDGSIGFPFAEGKVVVFALQLKGR